MSLTNFSAIDFKQLPTPQLIEPLSFERITSAILDDLNTLTLLFQSAELTINAKPIDSILTEMVQRSQAVTTLLKKYQRV
ncbi:hypothetical protein PSECIP111951_01136 [Pseudoalteromonas holothuriae]|uniref:Uncharacterized protein n=1 Tax=Pseudoalteromonas holothuriae TaxID=2963714 RepID=A0ABM9GFT1_9GAMM|nr:hypothetical protein [Pseudoalteromonas sp. CIP111951]CAH9054916.1 hypothetical protein PSECIP111951_01136 [Pseudoalteromonas sp. CIP111951]